MLDTTGGKGPIYIEDMKVGMVRHLDKTVSDRDIELFAEVSEDSGTMLLHWGTVGVPVTITEAAE